MIHCTLLLVRAHDKARPHLHQAFCPMWAVLAKGVSEVLRPKWKVSVRKMGCDAHARRQIVRSVALAFVGFLEASGRIETECGKVALAGHNDLAREMVAEQSQRLGSKARRPSLQGAPPTWFPHNFTVEGQEALSRQVEPFHWKAVFWSSHGARPGSNELLFGPDLHSEDVVSQAWDRSVLLRELQPALRLVLLHVEPSKGGRLWPVLHERTQPSEASQGELSPQSVALRKEAAAHVPAHHQQLHESRGRVRLFDVEHDADEEVLR
eukprot:7108057-Prymnesium_polylepis.2